MVTPTAPASPGLSDQGDQLTLDLARFVQALHARYPDGPDQMRREALDARANMPRMRKDRNGRAA
jgi:hypothetical protein